MGGAGGRVGADVVAVEVVSEFQFGELLREADRVERVAGGPEDRADLRGPLLEALHVVGAVVEDHARVGVVDAVVDVVAEFVVSHRLADDLRDGGARRGDQEPSRLGENLDLLREKSVELVVDLLGQVAELGHARVVGRGEPATDIEQLEGEAA